MVEAMLQRGCEAGGILYFLAKRIWAMTISESVER